MRLAPEETAALDKLSKPTLGFPMQFMSVATMFSHSGATVNGEKSIVWPLAPASDAERY